MSVKDYMSKLMTEGTLEEPVETLSEGKVKEFVLQYKEMKEKGKKDSEIQKALKVSDDDWVAVQKMVKEDILGITR